MKINEIILNELKEYINPNSYGAWINTNGKVDNVDSHQSWLHHIIGPSMSYKLAFEKNWVKITNKKIILFIQGDLNNIRKTFKFWWPTAISKLTVVIESSDSNYYKEFIIPDDKAKLLKDFGPNNENK